MYNWSYFCGKEVVVRMSRAMVRISAVAGNSVYFLQKTGVGRLGKTSSEDLRTNCDQHGQQVTLLLAKQDKNLLYVGGILHVINLVRGRHFILLNAPIAVAGF